MKSLKKTLVLLVVFAMILSTVVPAFAATANDTYGLDCEEEVARLQALKVVAGYEDGSYKPENTITRAEMAVILCKMVGIDEVTCNENKSVPSKFSDVAVGEWYTGYINVAAGKGFLSGFPDGTFRPNDQLTMNQVLTLCVNALGRGEYVATMGAWPANYITEATKLGLLDGVKTSDANRGNVAIIVWNTLEAPVWDVQTTEYKGTINLSETGATLLSIYFRDYIDENGDLKEVEVAVIGTPANKSDIGDRQIVLEDTADFDDIEFKALKKKDVKEESTYRNAINDVVAYVPEEVYTEIDSLKGKNVTVILGKDNIVASITLVDDLIENEYLVKYADDKITVGQDIYRLANNYDVVLNEEDYADLDAALTALGIADFEDIEKAIETTLTLDVDNKVEKIELFASATIANVSTETIVTNVKETSKKYKIETVAGNIEWDIDDEEDLTFPRVYIDGKKADIKDIKAGNVLTILGDSATDVEHMSTIYVSTETVVGDAERVRKANNAISIDGKYYMPSFDVTARNSMTEEELKENEWIAFNSTTILDNDEVTLYMNVLGEYVAVAITEATNDYQFGVVTYIASNITWEGDDEEIAVRNMKILLPTGDKKTFKVKVDTDDDDIDGAVKDQVVNDGALGVVVGDFVIFEASADSVITMEDGDEIEEVDNAFVNADYYAKAIDATVAVDGKTFTDEGGVDGYACTSNTVIFNVHADKYEIVKDWASIIDNADKVPANTYAVMEDGSKKASYIIVDMNDYTSSDALYAIVASKLVEVKKGKFEIDFVGEPDLEVKDDATVKTPLTNAINWLVRYTTSSNKVNTAGRLIDLDAFVNDVDDEDLLDDEEVVTQIAGTLELSTQLLTKKHFKVEEVTLEKDYASIEFADDVELTAEDAFATGTYYVFNAAAAYAEGTDYYKQDGDNYVLLTAEDGFNAVVGGGIYAAGSDDPVAANAYDAATVYHTASATDGQDATTTIDLLEEAYGSVATAYTRADAGVYAADTNYYAANGTFAGQGQDLGGEGSLGLVRLDEDNLVVLDARDGEIKEIKLTDVPAKSYAIVYNEVGISTKDGNVVIVVE